MALLVERLLAARFCSAIARFIHRECFLSLDIKPEARIAAGQFEASATQPTRKCGFAVGAKGHFQMMRWLVFRYSLDWNQVLKGASYGGHLRFVYFAMNNGATCRSHALYRACRGGHVDVAEFMISKGANDWDGGLSGAYQGGHRNIAEWMISKGANHWNSGLRQACQAGCHNLAEFMISKGAIYWDGGGGCKELAKVAVVSLRNG
jgi:hypothetical protein